MREYGGEDALEEGMAGVLGLEDADGADRYGLGGVETDLVHSMSMRCPPTPLVLFYIQLRLVSPVPFRTARGFAD